MSTFTPAASRTRAKARFSDADLTQARANLAQAFTIGKLVAKGNPVCPSCHTATKGKVALFPDGVWHCHRCGQRGNAVDALTLVGFGFNDAVAALLGHATDTLPVVPDVVPLTISESFRANVDVDVYATVMEYGSLPAAQRHYAAAGITPDAVAELGAVVILTPDVLMGVLRARFGDDRLVASGLVTPPDTNRPMRLLVNDQYPVVEPHRAPDGTVVGMQFRAAGTQLERIAAHKRGEGPYVPKFLSLRGAGDGHLLGGGLPRLAAIAPSTVRIVEGVKDLLAARTLGWEAYALPGAGTVPPPVALDVLARHRVQVAFDGDEAGQAGGQRLLDHLVGVGIDARAVRLPNGMDVAEMLAARRARSAQN